MNVLDTLWRARKGNIALTFALLAPVLLGLAGGAIDYARYFSLRDSLQEIADTAALAGARQFVIASDQPLVPKSVAEDVAQSGINASLAPAAARTVSVNNPNTSVTVDISFSYTPTFLVALYKNPISFDVTATAVAKGSANICVIATNASAKGTIALTGSAKITGPKCAFYSNSDNKAGLTAWETTLVTSKMTCTAGGYGGASGNFKPLPTTDCPPREDPLSSRTAPAVGACNHNNFKLENYTGSVDPGVYCGGLTILGASDVTFNPGIYVIKDGDMKILDTARVWGLDVGFYFAGNGSSLFMEDNSDVSFSGPLTGDMAGILIWQEDVGKSIKVFQIASNNVHTLVGTIYLPKGRFVAYANAPIAKSSAYTAIVADQIELFGNADLVLNTDYGMTPVPVPAGISSAGGEVFLRD